MSAKRVAAIVSALVVILTAALTAVVVVPGADAAKRPVRKYRCLATTLNLLDIHIHNLEGTEAKFTLVGYDSAGTLTNLGPGTLAPRATTSFGPNRIVTEVRSRSRLLVTGVEDRDTDAERTIRCT